MSGYRSLEQGKGMKQPTIFLSSTIYDFRDLRSALKFYLEQQGCTVLASEFNDFQKPLDAHSYDACLTAIGMADYFILLIGSRVGGWYDKANRISITRQEYRAAYELHKQGRLNILTFVRSEVWQVREDRKALSQHLETLSLTDSEKQAVMTSPSKFANDAEFISAFIDEVGKNKETKKAIETGDAKPTGNWIHVFKDFDEIISAVRPLLFRGLPAQEAAFRKALEAELLELLALCMLKYRGEALSPVGYINKMRERCPITDDVKQDSRLPFPRWRAYLLEERRPLVEKLASLNSWAAKKMLGIEPGDSFGAVSDVELADRFFFGDVETLKAIRAGYGGKAS